MVKPLQDMIKKNVEFKWGSKEKEAFDKIKEDIEKAPTLLSPYFDRDFILYTFSSDIAFVVVLTQKNSEGDEFPMDFMSSGLQGVEINYPEVDKHAYAVFKVVKHFRPFLLKSKTKVIVPYLAVRNLLVQRDLAEKRANWITDLQEYDLEIKPTKIVKGKGLCKLVMNPPASSLRKMLCIKTLRYLKKNFVTSQSVQTPGSMK
jgi:hypothetical protein